MRVLISGGGVAGLTLANFLHRYGMEPVVIERADDRRSDGYAIDFFGTGYDVAERIRLIDRLQAEHIPVETVGYVSQSEKPIANLDIALMRKVMHSKYMALMRLSLEQALYAAIAGSLEVQFCRSLAAVQQSPEAVSATFNDDTTETFDLLIGAEGIHSNTRDLVFGPEEKSDLDATWATTWPVMPCRTTTASAPTGRIMRNRAARRARIAAATRARSSPCSCTKHRTRGTSRGSSGCHVYARSSQ